MSMWIMDYIPDIVPLPLPHPFFFKECRSDLILPVYLCVTGLTKPKPFVGKICEDLWQIPTPPIPAHLVEIDLIFMSMWIMDYIPDIVPPPTPSFFLLAYLIVLIVFWPRLLFFSDPDPDWSGSRKAKITHKKRKKLRNSKFEVLDVSVFF
jgi:hypothetical protein